MKTTWKVAAAAVLIGGGIWAGSLLNEKVEGAGVTNQPGTADDPVVTKSYVDQQIQQALKGASSNSSSQSTDSSSSAQAGNTAASSSDEVKIVEVKPGQKLIAAAGAEFVVRAGKAVIYSEDQNGVADLTDGKDITNGGIVTNNHLLSFPRAGRGIQHQEGQTHPLTVMVRGGYSIQ
ncbi:hypothetical protein QNH46_22265 [Paenibacillus woosongensis]|uniref:Uncharacterized protein n=1 Tax=Paenibacillus woosongensis TaxID=307580 RepID=A0AA95L1K0_9BACL|nr:hypothetical protein [Paenibacillus woosongensis]WHX48746.1 hypothetical protein QNH46_22265 [Paenibacillus woosongensis]